MTASLIVKNYKILVENVVACCHGEVAKSAFPLMFRMPAPTKTKPFLSAGSLKVRLDIGYV